ncbi:hypothetical protein SK128_026608, partial [Halocaridina rubra]
DPHALETFLETLPSSSFPTDGGLLWQGLDSPRFDNVTSSTDSGLVSSCLDNLVLDGQFLGQVRGGSHPLSHSQVPTHVLQQVLPSPTLSAAPQGAPHPQQQQPSSQQQQQQLAQHQHPQQQHHHSHTHHNQQNVGLQSPGAPQVGGVPSSSSSSSGDGNRENEHTALHQLFGTSASYLSQQHSQSQVQPQGPPLHQQNVTGTVGHSLPPTILTTSASRLPSIQQASHLQQQLSIHPASRPVGIRSQISPATKNAGTPNTPQHLSQVIPQAATATPSQIMSSGVQLVGGPGQVITSGGQIITSGAPQLIQGTQLLQGPSSQVMSTGQLLSGQVLHNGSVIQGGQVLHGAHMLPGGQLLHGGQVIQGGQVLQGGQLLQSSQVINGNHLITTTTSPMVTSSSPVMSTTPSPSYGASSTLAVQQQQTSATMHQSVQSPASATSPFSVPTKSPGTALPRTSPSPSPYNPTTPSPHPSVQSPAPYTTRSPAPSPHSSVGTMKSPAPPTPSPAATPTSQAHSSITTIPQPQASGMVQGVMGNGSMVQSIVPQLPLSQVVGSNGMVLPQTTVQQQAASGVKQVVSGGQIIQIVSSPQPTQPRQPLVTQSHKPIQPKQPQLLPKPPLSVSSGQPPTPQPPGKSLIGTRAVAPGNQQPIVIGAAGQPTTTMMTNQQGIGSFVINPSPLQSGLQQPILIQQPNGVLLVRPSGPTGAGGAPAQAFIVPMPGQPQIVSGGTKAGQPQTVVFPSGGQGGPAFVIPQNATSLGAPGVMGAAQSARGPQPIIRLVAPPAPLQLQQISTPNGPTLVALPTGQVNLSGLLTAGGATVRTLAPQVASGPLQLAPSSVAPPNIAPVAASMGHLHMTGATGQQLHVSVPGAPLQQLTTSLPSSLPSVITTTKQTVIEESVAPSQTVVSCSEAGAHNQALADTSKNAKKKSKKKKKEKEAKDEKLKGKGGSINLNDILKETGIVGDLMLFDDNELNLGGDGMEGGQTCVTASVKSVAPVVSPTSSGHRGSISESAATTGVGISDGSGHVVLGTHQPMLVGMNNSVTPGTVVISSAPAGLGAGTNMPSGMCFTLDATGKVIFGADPSKTHIGAQSLSAPSQVGGLVIPSSQAQVQVLSSGGLSGLSSSVTGATNSGAVVNVMSSMPTIVSGSGGPIGTGILPTVGSLPSFTQLLTPTTQVTTNATVQGSSIVTRTLPLQLQTPSGKVTQVMAKNQTGADISRVAQNTHLLQALQLPSEKASVASGPPILTSMLTGGLTGNGSSNPSQEQQTCVPVQVSVGDGSSMVTVVSMGNVMNRSESGVMVSSGTTFSSPTPHCIFVTCQASQVPPSPAVIVSSSATNSVVSGAIINHKPFITNSALIPQSNLVNNNNSNSTINTENVPISRGHPQIAASALHHENVPSHFNHSGVYAIKNSEIGSSKPPSYQNEYVATLQRSQNLIDINKSKSKSSKKRKKDRETEPLPVVNSSQVIIKQSLHERLKTSSSANNSGIIQQTLSLPNGLSSSNLKTPPSHQAAHSVTVPVSSHDGIIHCNTSSSVVGSNIPNVGISTPSPPISTATTSVQTPPIHTTTTSSTPTTTTTATSTTVNATSTSHTPTGVMIQNQKSQVKQVKRLILTPHNQEALKKVHCQIQALQNNNSDQDTACLQQLFAEYNKIVATGKCVTVSTGPQQPQVPQPSQPTPVRYSHPVGHKIITVTQFKQPVKHLPQTQQVVEQNKQLLPRWKDPSVVTTAMSGITLPSNSHMTTSPQVSPSGQ